MLAANGQSIDVCTHLDTCGSQNLASEHLLQNIKKVEDYDHNQIYMVTVNGKSPAYTRMGELHFIDEDKNPMRTAPNTSSKWSRLKVIRTKVSEV